MHPLFKLAFCVFLLIFTVKAQTPIALPTPPIESEDELVCGLRQPPLIQFSVSVTDSENKYLRNLTYKDFVIYSEERIHEIVFFEFDELKEQYVIGFYEDEFGNTSDWRNVKIKVKFLEEKKKTYGKVFVEVSKAYRSHQN